MKLPFNNSKSKTQSAPLKKNPLDMYLMLTCIDSRPNSNYADFGINEEKLTIKEIEIVSSDQARVLGNTPGGTLIYKGEKVIIIHGAILMSLLEQLTVACGGQDKLELTKALGELRRTATSPFGGVQ